MPRWLFCTLLVAACARTPEPPAPERQAPVVRTTPSPPTSAAPVTAVAPDLPGKRPGHGAPGSKIKHVIVIAMENHDADQIYTDTVNAPYIHSLVETYAPAENFDDELPLEIP